MKKTSHSVETKLMMVLKGAYRARTASAVPPGLDADRWVHDTMRQIRKVAKAPLRPDFMTLFGQAIWRWAPVTAIAGCLLAFWLFQFDFSADIDVATLLLEDPIGYSDLLWYEM